MFSKHMERRAPLALTTVLLIIAAPERALCQEHVTTPQQPAIGRAFAGAGLTAKFNSSEAYGATQSRMGLYRSHLAYSQATGITDGYRDDVRALVAPVNVTLPIGSLGDKNALKLGAAMISTRAAAGNLTRVDNDSVNLVAQAVHPIGDRAVIGIGLAGDSGVAKFRHNGGEAETTGKGVRLDYMQLSDASWGLSARVLYLDGSAKAEVPTKIGVVRNRRALERLYGEFSVIGAFRSTDSNIIPAGWVVRPALNGVAQVNHFGSTIDSLGKSLSDTEERYAVVSVTARLEKEAAGKGAISPYIELGAETEVINNMDAVDHDATSLYYKIGAGTTVTGRERIDIYYAGRDGTNGQFHAATLNLLVSASF